jgi:hypothetical protein
VEGLVLEVCAMVRIQGGGEFYILLAKRVLKVLLVFSNSLRMSKTLKYVGNLQIVGKNNYNTRASVISFY